MSRVLMHFCDACQEYTLKTEACPHCGGKVAPNRPPKFSPEDPYGSYRRRLKALDKAERSDDQSAPSAPPPQAEA